MSKAEILRKFDAIVEFAEVEKFLDTPVKRYSSGMYVRLAFSVAAHLESDILIVDEVLAVGDAEFQKKCMSRMESVSKEGRTILFVSHNMGAIGALCNRAVLLNNGSKVYDGTPAEVISAYLGQRTDSTVEITPRKKFPIYVSKMRLIDESGDAVSRIRIGSDATIEIEYIVDQQLKNVRIGLLLSRQGIPLLNSFEKDIKDQYDGVRSIGKWMSRITLPLRNFKEGLYTLEVTIVVNQDNLSDDSAVFTFDVFNDSIDTFNKSFRADRPGHLYCFIPWQTERVN
jgi:lipopolysaccharide transport system ATP-binding protein